MKIKIWEDKYMISSDRLCYKLSALQEKAEDGAPDEDDKDYGVTIGYYPTMTSLFEDLVRMEGRMNRCSTLDGYIKHIERVSQELNNTLEQMKAVIGAKESVERILSLRSSQLPAEVDAVGEEPATEKPKRGRKKKTE